MTLVQTEADLVRSFGDAIANNGLTLANGRSLRAFVIGHEIALPQASPLGNNGAADILMVTEDGRLWLIEAKLASSSEIPAEFVFGNQLARYAASMERIGLSGIYSHLGSYFFSRRAVLRPPVHLADTLMGSRDLAHALNTWCTSIREAPPSSERILSCLREQLRSRTITLASLTDHSVRSHRDWIEAHADERSAATIVCSGGRATLEVERLKPFLAGNDGSPLPPFDLIPQTFKPTLATLPIVLREAAFRLYSELVAQRLERWTGKSVDEMQPSTVTLGACSLDIEGQNGRVACIQIGRTDLRFQGPTAGAYPLKILINLIWAGERAWKAGSPAQVDVEQRALRDLVVRLVRRASMRVRGIPRSVAAHSTKWDELLMTKIRGDEHRRTELVLVRVVGDREDFGWDATEEKQDVAHLGALLDALEDYLGDVPYRVIRRPKTSRKVPGTVRAQV